MRRAVELNPGNQEHGPHGMKLACAGQPGEALAWSARAMETDP
jgi:hypothetical protein